MAASRGDTKPCTAIGCAGTMQFGRRGLSQASVPAVQRPGDPTNVAMDAKGWVCSADLGHFRPEV